MKLSFEREFDASRDVVWSTLLDPEVLARVIPGVERFEQTTPDKFSATLTLGLPAVNGTYEGEVEIRDKVQETDGTHSFVLQGTGRGSQGWAEGSATVALVALESGTRVNVTAEAQIGGRIAGIGQRMIDGVAKSMAEEFFQGFERELQGKSQHAGGQISFMFRALLRFFRNLVAGKASN